MMDLPSKDMEIWTIKDIARVTGFSERTLYRYVEEGRFSYMKAGKARSPIIFTSHQVQEFFDSITVLKKGNG